MSNWLEILNQKLESGEAVTQFYLEDEYVEEFPPKLWKQPLEAFCLEDVAIKGDLPLQIFQISTLKQLDLSIVQINYNYDEDEGEDLSEVPEEIGNLSNLEYLTLSELELKKIPSSLSQLENLKHLDISYNYDLDLKKVVFPKQLVSLNISSINSGYIPQSLLDLKSIKSLYISHYKLNDKSDFHYLPNLEKLDLSYNKDITAIPKAVLNLSNLKEIRLTSCGIEKLPEAFLELKKLNHLDISYNHITHLSGSISNLIQLKHLKCDHNQIHSVSPELGKLEHIETINFNYNKIASLPIELGQLISLKRLLITENKFQDFPKAVYTMYNLETLECMNNHFYQIFKGIAQLKKLKYLSLYRCYILFLVKEIEELENLESLNIGQNPIKKLFDFSKMKSLKHLDISGLVELENPDEEVNKVVKAINLENISLQYTNVVDAVFTFEALKSLKRINLANNELPENTLLKIRKALAPVLVWCNRFKKD